MNEENLDTSEVMSYFFAHQAWLLEYGEGRVMSGISIKISPGGFLAILKADTPFGPEVAFLGKRDLVGLYRALQSDAGRGALRWRQDKFRLDEK